MWLKIASNYSPNFSFPKRAKKEIKYIIIHYTGMKREKDAINRLTNYKSKVSSHYFIRNNGEVITLVPDLYVAWHAGISSWKNFKSINKYSIGIEISNSGHNNKYEKFSKKQINSVLKLSKILIKKYKIKSKFILGHSDIAPDRKKDPGEKFPWEYLSNKKVGIWHKLKKTNDTSTDRLKKVSMKLIVLCILGSIIFVCNALQAQPGEADPAPGIGLMLCVFLVLIMVYRMDLLLDEDYGMVYALVLISIIVSLIFAVCQENDGTKFAAWSLGGILFVGFCYACRTAIEKVWEHCKDIIK